MISESRRFAISNVMLVLSIGLLAFVSMDSFGTGCANAATGSCQVGDTETFSADLGLGGDVIFEGATDDDFETSLTATDPTADRTITMPDYSGDLAVYTGGEGTATQVLTSNGPGVAPSYQDIAFPDYSTGIEFEGATDDAFETTLSITDPTADRTVTVPNASGTIQLSSNAGTNGQILTQSASGVPSYQDMPAAGTTEWWCESDYGDGRVKLGNSSSYSSILTAGPDGLNCQTDITASQEGEGTYYGTFETWWYIYDFSGSTASVNFQYLPSSGGAASQATFIQNGYQLLCSPYYGYNSGTGVQGEWYYWGNDDASEYTTNSGWTSGETSVYVQNCRSVTGGHAFKLTYTFVIRVAPNQGFNLYDTWDFYRYTGNSSDYARMTRSILHVTKVSDRYS